ncbi:MAG: hypothetical protein EOS41_29565 [Mesorhizobium sp.]|uniref:hypothetical protein n=1 Tax=Mesorhizobium sp. TaxID=1871066 RepID=UPI000FE8E5DD|nr:hypothetical protein [Mesorhizobium sp.]RWE19964.1 MAG: hypothetical protein EOS41_29565 [Mesorhizobium sp.]
MSNIILAPIVYKPINICKDGVLGSRNEVTRQATFFGEMSPFESHITPASSRERPAIRKNAWMLTPIFEGSSQASFQRASSFFRRADQGWMMQLARPELKAAAKS